MASATKNRAKGKSLSSLGVRTAGVASSVLVSKILTYLIAGISLLVVSRLLASTLYGIYVLVSSVAGVFVSFGTLGIYTSFTKFISEYRTKKKPQKINEVISSGYMITIVIGLLLSGIALALSAFISHLVFGTANYAYLISASSVLIIGSLVASISTYALIGFGRKNAIVGIVFLQILTQAVVSITLAWYHFGVMAPIIGVATGYLFGIIASLAYMAATEKVKFSVPSWKAMHELLVFSLPLGVFNLVSGIVGNLTNLILGAFASASVVGNVAISQRIGTTINSANESIAASLVPLFASVIQPGAKSGHISSLYNYALYLTFVLFAPVAIFLALFAKEITFIALGTGYPTVQFYLPIVSVGLLLMMVSDYTTSLLVGRNKVKPIMKYGTLAYLIEVVLLLLLVPTLKGYGMVIAASLLLPLTLLLFYHKAIADDLDIRLHIRRPVQVVVMALVATLAVFSIALLVQPVSLANDVAIIVAAAVALVVIYPPLLALTGTMLKKDVEIIKNLSSGIPVAGRLLYLLSEYAGLFIRK